MNPYETKTNLRHSFFFAIQNEKDQFFYLNE